MNLDLQIGPLRTLVTIIDEGGFGRAAEVLHITQPAVSHHIRRLESILKQPAFVRHGRNMRLSPAGEELLGYARKIIALNDEAVLRIAPRPQTVRVAIGVSDQFTDILPEILAGIKRDTGDTQVTIRTGPSDLLSEQMSFGGLDLALLAGAPEAKEVGEVRHIGRVGMGWFGRPPLARGAVLPLVMFTEPSVLRRHVLSAIEDSGTLWRIGYEGPELVGLRAAIQAGFGVGCFIANADELWQLPTAIFPGLPAPPPSIPLGLAVSPRVPEEFTQTATAAFHRALRDYPIDRSCADAARAGP